MAKKIEDGFTREVAKFALTSGLPRQQVATGFGISILSVERWVKQVGGDNTVSSEALDLVTENKRLRRELQIAQAERDILKKTTVDSVRMSPLPSCGSGHRSGSSAPLS